MSCKIKYDKFGNIEEVLDHNGNPSNLYQQALEYTGGNKFKALMLWAVPYTERFKKYFNTRVDNKSVSNKNKKNIFKDIKPIDKSDIAKSVDAERFTGVKIIEQLGTKLSDKLGINIEYFNDPNIQLKGVFDTNANTVKINLAYATLDTPIHEFLGHPIIRHIKENNKKLYDNIVKEVLNDEQGKKILERIYNEYPEFDKDYQIEEALVEMLSLMSANNITNNKTKSLLYRLFSEIKKFIKGLFGIKSPKVTISNDMTLEDISNLINDYIKETDNDISNYIKGIVNEVLGFDLGQRFEQRPENNSYTPRQIEKKYKKAFGERAYRLMRDTASGLLIEPDVAIGWIKEQIPIKAHVPFVMEKMGIQLEQKYLEFLKENGNKLDENLEQENIDPFELIRKAGYEVTEVQSPSDALTFKNYYGEGEVLCTYNNVEGRMSRNIIIWIKRPNAENILPADRLTQDNLSPEWKEYLEKEGRKNKDGTYNLKGLVNNSADPYGRSVVSIQINKNNGYLKEINRYNHRLQKGSVDNTFNKNLDNLIKGLHKSLYAKYDIEIPVSKFNVSDYDNLIEDYEGKIYYYNYEENGYYYSRDGYLHNGEYTKIDKNHERIIGNIFIDLKNKSAYSYNSPTTVLDFDDIKVTSDTVSFVKDDKTINFKYNKDNNFTEIYSKDWESYLPFSTKSMAFKDVEKVVLDKVKVIGNNFLYSNEKLETLSLPNVKSIGDYFLFSDYELKTLSLPNVESIGNNFLSNNNELKTLSLPNVESIGNNFLSNNNELKTLSLPNVKSIGDYFLFSDYELKTLSLPNVESIGNNFLYSNEKLETLSLPNVESIGNYFLSNNYKVNKGFIYRLAYNNSSFSRIQNKDISLKTILDILEYNLRDNKIDVLGNSDINKLNNNLLGIDNISTLQDLYLELRNTFLGKKNYFHIDEKKLRKSILYNKAEVDRILMDKELQNNIKELFDNLQATLLIEDDNNNFDNKIFNDEYEDVLLFVKPDSYIGIGKQEYINPYKLEHDLGKNLTGIFDKDDFDNAVNSLPSEFDMVKEAYNKNENDYQDRLFKLFSNKVKSYDVDLYNNKGQRVKELDVRELIVNTAVSADNQDLYHNLIDDYNTLNSIDIDIWDNQVDEVKGILDIIQKQMADIHNIDVVGLASLYDTLTKKEVVGIVKDLAEISKELNDINTNEDKIVNLLEGIYKYLKGDELNEYGYSIETTDNTDNLERVVVTPKVLNRSVSSQIELFRDFGLIETGIRGQFIKVEVIQDINTVYDMVYDLIQSDIDILPKEAFYPAGFNTDGTFNKEKVKDINNRLEIIDAIKNYVQKNKGILGGGNSEIAEKLYLYKLIFNTPIDTNHTTDTILGAEIASDEITKQARYFGGNYNYLTTNFINELYGKYLSSKLNNGDLYNKVYSNINFSAPQGITLKQYDDYTLYNMVIEFMELDRNTFNNFLDYARISRDVSLNIFSEIAYNIIDNITEENSSIISERMTYVNNTDLLPQYKGNYVLDNNLLISDNKSQDNFIRIKNNVYEKVKNNNYISVYQKITPDNMPNNAYYKAYDTIEFDYSLDKDKIANIDMDKMAKKFNSELSENGTIIETNKLYTDNELEQINKDIEECQ